MSHIYIWFAILYIISFSAHKVAILSNAVKYITQTFGWQEFQVQEGFEKGTVCSVAVRAATHFGNEANQGRRNVCVWWG